LEERRTLKCFPQQWIRELLRDAFWRINFRSYALDRTSAEIRQIFRLHGATDNGRRKYYTSPVVILQSQYSFIFSFGGLLKKLSANATSKFAIRQSLTEVTNRMLNFISALFTFRRESWSSCLVSYLILNKIREKKFNLWYLQQLQ